MENTYTITQEQLMDIEHYWRMFQLESENISGLCSTERGDIEYGFQLGQTYSHLRDCQTRLMELVGEIRQTKNSKQ